MIDFDVTLRPGNPEDADACGQIVHDAFALLERLQVGKRIASFQLVLAKLARILTEISKAQLVACISNCPDEGRRHDETL